MRGVCGEVAGAGAAVAGAGPTKPAGGVFPEVLASLAGARHGFQGGVWPRDRGIFPPFCHPPPCC